MIFLLKRAGLAVIMMILWIIMILGLVVLVDPKF